MILEGLFRRMFTLHFGRNWLNNVDMNKRPIGTAPCKLRGYGKYIVEWVVPNTSRPVKKFVLDDFTNDRILNDDVESLTKSSKERFNIIVDQLRNGVLVYTDDDDFIKSNYNNSNNLVYYEWDTQTHWLQKESDEDSLVMSKTIRGGIRLIYIVKRPVLENGKWVCHIVLDSCGNHKTKKKGHYTRVRNTLLDNAKYNNDVSELFSDTE